MLKNRKIVVGIAFVSVVAIVLYHLQLKPLDDQNCVGLSEAQLIERFGKPSERWAGTFGAPPVNLIEGRVNIETLLWKRLSGTLYVSTSEVKDSKVCFEAAWLPRGAVF